MQRGLVDYKAMDGGHAVALTGKAQPVKPGGPSNIELPHDADFVAPTLVAITS